MTRLTQPHSPLEQVRKHQRIRQVRSRRPLSPADQVELKRLLSEKYEYEPNELFELPEAEAKRRIFDEAPPIPRPDTSWYQPVMNSVSGACAGKNVGSVLLSAKQERALFLQFNYCRFRAVQWRDRLQAQDKIDPHEGRQALKWFRKAERYRDQIARTNLALVLAMAKRTRMSEADFADLVSEGNMALLRAIDKFDVARGFKFSTYACRAILQAFSRAGAKLSKHRRMFPVDFDPALERSDHQQRQREQEEADCIDEIKHIIRCNQAELSEIEREIVQHRFAISTRGDRLDTRPLTLEQVGQHVGVTKERVRQIQNKALSKLRAVMQTKMDGSGERFGS